MSSSLAGAGSSAAAVAANDGTASAASASWTVRRIRQVSGMGVLVIGRADGIRG